MAVYRYSEDENYGKPMMRQEAAVGRNFDRDTLLIAALIYLLIKENGDMRLIIALGYILL